MQANIIAQTKAASQKLAEESLGRRSYGTQTTGSAFAEMFSKMQTQDYSSSHSDFSFGQNTATTENRAAEQTSSFKTESSDHTGYDTSSRAEDAAHQSSEAPKAAENHQEAGKADRPEDSHKASDDHKADKVTGEGKPENLKEGEATSEASKAEKTDKSHNAETKKLTAEEIASAVAALLSGGSNGTNQNKTLELDTKTKSQITSILQDMKGKTNLEDAQVSLNRLAEVLKSNQQEKSAVNKGSEGVKGQETNLKQQIMQMLNELDPNAKVETKGMNKESGKGENKAKVKEEFSALESAITDFTRRKTNSETAEKDMTGTNSKDKSAGNAANDAVTKAASTDTTKNSFFSMREAAMNFTRKTEGETGAKQLDNGALRAESAINGAKQNMTAGKFENSTKQVSNQEQVIKNFQDVKALLDKQVVQVKETSASSMTIKLNPEELGKINIQLELLDNGKLQGKIFVENEVTKNSLMQNAEAMKDQIKAQGVSLESLEINLTSDGNHHEFQGFDQQKQNFNRQSHEYRAGYDGLSDEDELRELKTELYETMNMRSKLDMLV